jgi:biotin-dependent carboxylase-like uncharacterized protein
VSAMRVLRAGPLSLLQDSGRVGQYRIGLTRGGPLDRFAFDVCNRLLQNPRGSTCIEVAFGGLHLKSSVATFICVTGAPAPITINGEEKPAWHVLPVQPGDEIALGFAATGCRAYLGVADGFKVAPQFGSTATVMREGIGGLSGGPLGDHDELPCTEVSQRKLLRLPRPQIPHYHDIATLRLIPGYQQSDFSRLQQRRFFFGEYTVTERADRMGYRLSGPVIECGRREMLSEGICHGAVQVPADGQPIVLLADRQTIGGYPKLGAVLSLDTDLLAQLRPGARVRFTPISQHAAHNALHLASAFRNTLQFEEARP